MLRTGFLMTSVVACVSHAVTLAINSEVMAARLSSTGKSKPVQHAMLPGYWTPACTKCDLTYNGTIKSLAWKNATMHCSGFASNLSPPSSSKSETATGSFSGSGSSRTFTPANDKFFELLHALPVFDEYDAAANLSPLLSAVGTDNFFVPVGIAGQLGYVGLSPAVTWHST